MICVKSSSKASRVVEKQESSEIAHQLEEFSPLLLEEMHGHIVQFDVIGGLPIRLLSFPGQIVICFGNRLRAGLTVIVVHLVSPCRELYFCSFPRLCGAAV